MDVLLRIEGIEPHKRVLLLHGLVDTLGLDVKDWGNTDDGQLHEGVQIVTIIVPAVLTAFVTIVKTWIERDMVKGVIIKLKDGSTFEIQKGSRKDVEAFIKLFKSLVSNE